MTKQLEQRIVAIRRKSGRSRRRLLPVAAWIRQATKFQAAEFVGCG